MTRALGHSRLENRYVLGGELVCETAIHVGSGGSNDVLAASDMPVARDGAGRPYVPGSSFRGAFRAGLESLLRGLDRPERPLRICDPLQKAGGSAGDPGQMSCANQIQERREEIKKDSAESGELSEERAFELAWKRSCTVCRLFGNSFLASRIRIGDLRLLSDPDAAPTYLRDGVGLDRDLRSAAKGVLYSFEAVPAGARFELRVEIENAEAHELGLVLTGLSLFEQGFIHLGGKRARGLGAVSVRDLELTRWTPKDFFQQSGGSKLDAGRLGELRDRAFDHYVEGNT